MNAPATGPVHLLPDCDPESVELLITDIAQLCTVHEPEIDARGPQPHATHLSMKSGVSPSPTRVVRTRRVA